jgi:outer membrane immunogenic protein
LVKKSLSLAALSSAFLASGAMAADLPLKAPSSAAPSASPWSGFYLGGGIGFQASNTGETLDSLSFGSSGKATPAQSEPGLTTSEPLNGIAFRTSAYAGYNFQVARQWVLGIEGDVGTTSHSTTFAGLAFPDQSLQLFSAADGITARTTWDASARGRVGFLVAPTTLFYATGGAAWQHYEITTNCFSTLCTSFLSTFPGGPFSITPAVTSNSATKAGWTIGGGIETALGGHWFARADYRFADFGASTFTITRNTTLPLLNPIVNTFDVPFRSHTTAFGLAYKFGDEVAPSGASGGWFENMLPVKALPAKAVASSSWDGLYAGFAIGLRAAGTDVTTTGPDDPTLLAGPNGATSQPLNGTGFRGSPYVGWNWQIAPRWVVGIEGDVGFADQTTSLPGIGFSPGIDPFIGSQNNNLAVRTTWDASARGRVGFIVTPATLLYATAGAAWQHFEVTSTCGSQLGNTECGGLPPLIVTNSATKAGWTAGLGAETMLGSNWFARAEYRYADLGPSSFTINRQGVPTISFDAGLRTHTATFGVSYKFGGPGGLLFAN